MRPITLRNKNHLYLADYDWLDEYLDEGSLYVFEHWSFGQMSWISVPWRASLITLEDGTDMLFVRLFGIQCTGFGQELSRYDDMHGLALPQPERVSTLIRRVNPGEIWLVIWHKVGAQSHRSGRD